MRSLLRVDFYKTLKSKLTFIALLFVLGFALFSGLAYGGLDALLRNEIGLDEEVTTSMFSFIELTSTSFSFSNNVGLIIPILATILIIRDLSSGVIRNKIIVGQKRTEIYFSHFIVSLVFNLAFLFLYFIVFGGITLMFFFPKEGLSDVTLTSYILTLVLGIIGIIFITSFSTFMALGVKSPVLAIISTALLGIILSLFDAIFVILDAMSTLKNAELIEKILYLIPTYSGTVMMVGNAETVNWAAFIEGVIGFLFFSVFNCFLGAFLFNQKDVK